MAIDRGYIIESFVIGLFSMFIVGIVGMLVWDMYWKLYSDFGSHVELLRAIGEAIGAFVALLVGIVLLGHIVIRVSESINTLWN